MHSSNSFVRLRGHHLICLHFFLGSGRSPEFAKVVLRTRAQLDKNAAIVVKENDDVCEHCATRIEDEATCAGDNCGPCNLDAVAMDILGVRVGEIIEFSDIGHRLTDGIDVWREHACSACDDREDCAAMMDLLYRRTVV
ncbi:MAG: DUF1284 domain-containing protein [Actinomycetota bacterium]|jgi:hypothetical protein|nr:DUF1284 domain-containing protein [Actinomycetota bacterium]